MIQVLCFSFSNPLNILKEVSLFEIITWISWEALNHGRQLKFPGTVRPSVWVGSLYAARWSRREWREGACQARVASAPCLWTPSPGSVIPPGLLSHVLPTQLCWETPFVLTGVCGLQPSPYCLAFSKLEEHRARGHDSKDMNFLFLDYLHRVQAWGHRRGLLWRDNPGTKENKGAEGPRASASVWTGLLWGPGGLQSSAWGMLVRRTLQP